MSRSTTPAHAAGSHKVFTINWPLLGRRLRSRGAQLFTSARHRAAHTEYTSPTWMTQLRLTWFRLGLIALAIFVLTQKQIDFTFSVGADGVAIDHANASPDHVASTTALSMLPTGHTTSAVAAAVAPTWDVDQLDALVVQRYIGRFERVAKTEEIKFNIPAAAKLAMAILESEAGQSTAARNDNNHFAAAGNRHYDNAWSSWRAHSENLNRRFPELAHESVNYQQWIAALAKTGYSRDTQYAHKLLQLIDRFGLDRL